MNEIRQKIMEAVIDQFNSKGMKFTMDDISKELHISKKTIYKEFDDKDELFFATVEYGFSNIKKKEAEVLADDSLDLLEKISPCFQDKSLHPFAIKQRKQERRRKRAMKALENLDRVKSFDELLREAYERQMIEDSLEAVKKGRNME